MARIYLASSWRNTRQPSVVQDLRQKGHSVYDFRNPDDKEGFHWSSIDPDWRSWTHELYLAALQTEQAGEGFSADFQAMERADTFVLLMPCGRSAHLEMGWAVGRGRRTYILLEEGRSAEPELMYKMVDGIFLSLAYLQDALA